MKDILLGILGIGVFLAAAFGVFKCVSNPYSDTVVIKSKIEGTGLPLVKGFKQSRLFQNEGILVYCLLDEEVYRTSKIDDVVLPVICESNLNYFIEKQ